VRNKNGFTLVELLAVIVIIGIISLIAVPVITKLIEDSGDKVFKSNEKLLVEAAQNYYKVNSNELPGETSITKTITLETLIKNGFTKEIKSPSDETILCDGYVVVEKTSDSIFKYTSYLNCGNKFISDQYVDQQTIPVITLLGSSPINIKQGDTYVDAGATALDDVDGDITANIVVTNPVNTLISGTYKVTYNVTDSNSHMAIPIMRTVNVMLIDYVVSKGVNQPRLLAGMTPIKSDGTTWVDTTISDPAWYNYTTTDKQWANARTSDNSIWVWIPRYAYQIATNYHTSSAGTINIKFLKDTTTVASDGTKVAINPIYNGSSQTNYILHPAFIFGDTQLTGIWVAKFEASVSDTNDLCYTSASAANCDKTTLIPKIVPNVKSWRNIAIGNMFTVSRNMEKNNTYGWGTTGTGLDTHMMKNIEWGAAAYLAQSAYGKNSAVWMNPADDFTTGCAGDNASVGYSTGCLRAYNTPNGKNASTTGNIYGVYDMSGGAYEYVAAYVENGRETSNAKASSFINANIKYKDVYKITKDSRENAYIYASTKKGDAIYETSLLYTDYSAWYNDDSTMPYDIYCWFMRGGYYSSGGSAGLFFFNSNSGNASYMYGFRPILLIDKEL
jgi:prepilin-type N-terminal cleavage/methylation domain-containing protein